MRNIHQIIAEQMELTNPLDCLDSDFDQDAADFDCLVAEFLELDEVA